MSSAAIRPYRESDLEALYEVCLLTGDAGEDATELYQDPKIIGDVYAAPYGVLTPDYAFVVEDRRGVGGYVVGAPDTAAFAARLEAEWRPALRSKHPDPVGDPASWTPDQRRAHSIHHPKPLPEEILASHPAHLHLNLVERLRRRGVGRALVGRWMDHARASGVEAAHVGVASNNPRGLAFWRACGFTALGVSAEHGTAGTIWLGRQV